MSHFVAVDLGASSGRLMVGHWDGRRFSLDELHRFPNSGVSLHGSLYWDALRIWSEIQNGLIKFRARFAEPPAGIAVDAWGVDFALLDSRGRLLDNPSHYRDPRTNGIPQRLFERIPEADLYAATGVQSFQFNTLFQLYSMVLARDPRLESAETLLMVPDLFNYFLGGAKAVEFTEASTSEMFNHATRDWHRDLLRTLSIPDRILPPVVAPATVLSNVGRDLLDLCGFSKTFPVIAVASHDTASAVASIPNLDAHSAFISSGTWSLMGVELPSPILSDAALAGGFTNEGGVAGTTRFLRNIPGLWLVSECRRRWQRDGRDYGWDELVAMAERAPGLRSLIDPDHPDLLNPPDMPAAIDALCRATGQERPEKPGEVVRCCLDSLALRCRATLDDLAAVTGERPTVLRVVGGGSRNRLLCQLTADACGVPLVAGPVEATAFGNVIVQAIAAGELAGIAEGRAAVAASVNLETYEPRAGADWDAALSRLHVISAHNQD
jgi:rhamnulokinase